MKPLTFFTWLCGNPLGFLLVAGFGGYLLFAFFAFPMANGWCLFWGFILVVNSLNARGEYRRHRAIERAWEAANGLAGRRAARRAKFLRGMVIGLSMAAWLASSWWIECAGPYSVGTRQAGWVWLLISAAWLVLGLRRLARWGSAKREVILEHRAQHHQVTILLPRFQGGGALQGLEQVLPEYCQRLIGRPR